MGIFSSPPVVNSRGDEMSDADKEQFKSVKSGTLDRNPGYIKDPAKRAEMLYNWLTAGGPPKPVDVSKIFAEKQGMSGVEEKASAGQGINSLFGIGNLIGDMGPVAPDLGGPLGKIEAPKMIEPLNQSPMQAGVPYSAKPVGGK